nr:MAG TPA: hypothetical protein [Caudoviricetes sp.]
MNRLTYFKDGYWRLDFEGVQYQAEFVDRLAAYEDTGLTPLNVNNMKVAHGNALSTISELRKALVDKREELKTAYDSISQLDGANSSLMAANSKLAADRKALINELCQYCGKYKKAHEGTCDGCRWREM